MDLNTNTVYCLEIKITLILDPGWAFLPKSPFSYVSFSVKLWTVISSLLPGLQPPTGWRKQLTSRISGLLNGESVNYKPLILDSKSLMSTLSPLPEYLAESSFILNPLCLQVVNSGYLAPSQFLLDAKTTLFLLTQKKKEKRMSCPENYGLKSLGSADNCSLENTWKTLPLAGRWCRGSWLSYHARD